MTHTYVRHLVRYDGARPGGHTFCGLYILDLKVKVSTPDGGSFWNLRTDKLAECSCEGCRAMYDRAVKLLGGG